MDGQMAFSIWKTDVVSSIISETTDVVPDKRTRNRCKSVYQTRTWTEQ